MGWLGWAKNGQQAGSSGFGFRLEGLQIKLVKKGGVAPEGTQFAFISPSDGGFNTKQLRILSAAQRMPWAGSGRCAAWVEIVYQAAGLGIINGNACDLWRRYCHTSDIKELKPGMIVAVQRSGPKGMSYRYGHVGLYIGNGKVRHNVGAGVKTIPLGEWLDKYNYSKNVAWGFMR